MSPSTRDLQASGYPALFTLRLHDREHFVLAHDEVLLTVNLDFLPRVLPEQDRVSVLDVELLALDVFLDRAGAHGEHLALLRLFLGGIGNDDPADFLFAFLEAPDDDAIV